MKIYSSFDGAFMTLRYILNDDGRMGLLLLPHGVDAPYAGKGYFDSLAHVCLEGDAMDSGFAMGVTMRNSTTTLSLRFTGQEVQTDGTVKRIRTFLAGGGIEIVHEAEFDARERAVPVRTSATNAGTKPVAIQLLTSFSLGGLTPFKQGEANERLKVHRLTSFWSAEGRALTQSIPELNMESSWSQNGYRAIRFGVVGSHPVKGYFPFLALEDEAQGVTWGALLCGASSWQMELTRRHEEICLSGGLADADFGHFTKELAPGETLVSPDALLASAEGSYDAVCRAVVSLINHRLPARCESERDLPVIFNEFCTTWGNPNLENIRAIADRIAGHGIRYFVIDAGWYAKPDGNWETDMGDWQVSQHVFPGGIRRATDYIRQKGMIPGLWFEMENVGPTADTGKNADWLLKRGGNVIRAGFRRMLDLENPEVIAHLDRTVIGLLREGNFGYVKVDYNESIGVGCDGYESLGEGLRRKVLANQAYFRHLKESLPDLVVESCASGGHRLVPSMFALSDMSSVSDAHECPELPLIVANTALLTPARHNQIWAVLRCEDSEKRLYYSLCATMLGRMCLSGDVHRLTPRQWKIVDEAIAFYKKIVPVLQDGDLYIEREGVNAYRKLSGWQAVRRVVKNDMLVVAHCFDGQPEFNAVHGDLANWRVTECFGIAREDVILSGEGLTLRNRDSDSGCALLLTR